MDLEKENKNINERNKRVELDKKWETSWTRRICIMILTSRTLIKSYKCTHFQREMQKANYIILYIAFCTRAFLAGFILPKLHLSENIA